MAQVRRPLWATQIQINRITKGGRNSGRGHKIFRLVGAQDNFVARAFTRRFTLRSLAGAAAGTLAGMATIAALPSPETPGAFLSGLDFRGVEWTAPLAIPLLAGLAAFWATRVAAFRRLRETR